MKILALLIFFISFVGGRRAFAFLNPLSLETQKMAHEISADNADVSVDDYIEQLKDLGVSHAPLTDVEALAVVYYTGDGYKALDEYLEIGTPARPTTVRVLDRALSKLPIYTRDVYHMQTLSAAELANLRPGAVLTWSGYLSCSRQQINFVGNVRFLIHQHDGHDISNLSMNAGEDEVLLPHGEELKILQVQPEANSALTLVEATEL